MRVAKWGNGLAVRLPTSVVEVLELRAGDDIEIMVDAPRTFVVRRQPDATELLERVRRFRGKLPADFKFNRGGTNGEA
ncbi:AbrB/MazE/SpoVT family DNA-binding domain-containing protein [Pseudomonas aeruginosa]